MQTNLNRQLDKQVIQKEWQKTFGHPAPVDCHPSFLEKVLSWQIQAGQHSGLKTHEKKILLGEGSSRPSALHPGSRLIRVWQGETHQVTVLADGYLYQDQRWKSLSSIAKAITPWSGPAFFGLKK